MSFNLNIITQDEGPTMAPPIFAPFPPPVPTTKKSPFQPTINGKPSHITIKSVTVPTFRKKNGTLVASHIRFVEVNNSKSLKKVTPNKKKNAPFKNRHTFKLHSPSTALAHSLHIDQLQKLLHPDRDV
jgi:hypothetical protein